MKPDRTRTQWLFHRVGLVTLTSTTGMGLLMAQPPAPPAPATDREAVAKKADAPTREAIERQERLIHAETMLRLIVLTELQFTRNVCDVGQDQIRSIARDAALAERELATELTIKPWPDDTPNSNLELLKGANVRRLEQTLEAIAKRYLTPKQWETFQDEAMKRGTHRKKVVVTNTIAILNKKLVLTQTQRRMIRDALEADRKFGHESGFFILDQACPQVPENCVIPHLTDTQKQVWSDWRRTNGSRLPAVPLSVLVVELNVPLVGTRADDEREMNRALETAVKPSAEK